MKKICLSFLSLFLLIGAFNSEMFIKTVKADSCEYEECDDSDNKCRLRNAQKKQQCLQE